MKNMTILKRLGYICERTGLLDEYTEHFQDIKLTTGYSKLDTISKSSGIDYLFFDSFIEALICGVAFSDQFDFSVEYFFKIDM